MNMNKKNTANRTIAGMLAALSLISCMSLPTIIASAEEVTAETPQITITAMNTPETEAASEEATEQAAETATEAASEEAAEQAAETATEAASEEAAEQAAETATEAASETAAEQAAEAAQAKDNTTQASDTSEIERQKIKAYFDHTIESKSVINTETYSNTQNGTTKKLEKNGNTLYVITKTPMEDNGSSTSFSTLGETSKCYPGALVYADEDLAAGNPAFINLNRNNICLTVQNAPLKAGEKPTVLVEDPSKISDVNTALAELNNRFDDNADSGAMIEYKVTSVLSEDQLKAAGSLNQSIYGKLKLDFSAASSNKKQIVMLEYNQIYYQVHADMQLGGAAFAPNETLESVSSLITNDRPAAMITTVNYGRKIVACIETDDMTFDLKSAVEASITGDKAGGKASVDYSKKMSNCHVSYYVYGGTAGNSADIISNKTPTDLMTAINAEAKFTKNGALPISYTASFLKDGKTAQVNFCGKYCKTTVEVRKPVPVTINATERWGRLKSYTVKITGQRIRDINDDGTFKLGDEETLANITLKSNGNNNDFVEFPADVDLSTVRVWFDYEGWSKSGFDSATNGLRLTKDCSALHIQRVNIDMYTCADYWFWYSVWGRVGVTDTNGNKHEQTVHDM